MTEYKLLTAESATKLTNSVNEHLKDGWQVHGSPFVYGMHNQPAMVVQAVVKWEEARADTVEILPVPPGLTDTDIDEEVKRFFGMDLGNEPFKYGYDS